jgi:hypothetical protein
VPVLPCASRERAIERDIIKKESVRNCVCIECLYRGASHSSLCILSCYQCIIIVIELTDLSIKICGLLLYLSSAIHCISALLTDLIETVRAHRNVSHDVIEKYVQ